MQPPSPNRAAPSLEAWRAQVERELAGKSFDKTLVTQTPEGVFIAPLYTDAPGAMFRESAPAPAPQWTMKHEATSTAESALEDAREGAAALWIPSELLSDALLAKLPATFLWVDVEAVAASPLAARLGQRPFAFALDPLAAFARGVGTKETLAADVAKLAGVVKQVELVSPGSSAVAVTTLPYHEAGAHAVDELACALSAMTAVVNALLEQGVSLAEAARTLAVQISVGRDTFVELCKLRALRTLVRKFYAAAGLVDSPRLRVHAIASSRTLSARDPWVNLLRVTTEAFAGILGGADFVTPLGFDEALGPPTGSSRRIARNTGLVLQEESHLSRVTDPAGGAYYFESLTDALARAAWEQFRTLEREGGLVAQLSDGRLAARLAQEWTQRERALRSRKIPVLGVSEFANLDETLPPRSTLWPAPPAKGLPLHRDAAVFEALRDQTERTTRKAEVVLLTLGNFAESRPRAGFASAFFSAGGFRPRETTNNETAKIVCLCGTDAQYAAEAVDRAKALKALGCEHVVLAGKPGALEASLRAAGVEDFLFVGGDVISVLEKLSERAS